ncbi:MAG TPA: DUF4845 domain-containing protein [Wenzhouxiangella sp.]|nr:DUF4845 domain-containing protein [Wenzhouxiangella sp.]
MKSLQEQRGMTLIGFVFLLLVVLFFTFIGIKIVPVYMNHVSLMSEVKSIASQPGAANKSPNAIRKELASRIEISYIKHIEPRHIKIETGTNARVLVKYDVEQHLLGNIDAIIRFDSAQPLQN